VACAAGREDTVTAPHVEHSPSASCPCRLTIAYAWARTLLRHPAEDSAGWAASVRAVPPRNRAPPGRCAHSATAHGEGRSVYVFGGYASGHGALGELWVFGMDSHEWWQPNTTGEERLRGPP
jgi:hypothetical protein